MFLESKNRLHDSFFDNINGCCLDKSQRKIVLDDSESLLVVAGAGSGKTLCIMAKVKYLIERKKYDPKDILLISFTNETVNNLKRKLNYSLDIYTFHKLSLRILRENDYSYHSIESDLLEYLVNEYFKSMIYDNNLYLLVENYFALFFKKKVSYSDITTKYIQKFLLFKQMIISFINRMQCNNQKIEDIKDYFNRIQIFKNREHYEYFLIIVLDIYAKYLEELHSIEGIDFDLMITKGLELVKLYGMYHNYKYIIIDEFQDTSFIRYQLIKEIINKTNAKIMCVGDDYQSIYAFSGCNIDLFVNFSNYFPNSKTMFIKKTYRNCYEIVHTSCNFIKKNPYQLKKNIKATFILKNPFKLIYYENDYQNKFYQLLDYLIDNNYKNILVLGRNNQDIYSLVDKLEGDFFNYKGVSIKYLTVHKSKGLEEEIVILINANNDYLGFPNKIRDDKIFSIINSSKEKIEYAEERRLFYVALTRTKKYLYIFSHKNNPSPFVLEIMPNLHIINKL